MNANDKTIIELLTLNKETLGNMEANVVEAAKKVTEAEKVLEAAEFGDPTVLELNCDDAANHGCIACRGYGMTNEMLMPIREIPMDMLKAMYTTLKGMVDAEKDIQEGAFAERGHTVEEWMDDIKKVCAVRSGAAMAENQLFMIKADAREIVAQYREELDKITRLVSLLSDDAKTEMEIARIAGRPCEIVIDDILYVPEVVKNALVTIGVGDNEDNSNDYDDDEEDEV